jgi:hypothetical protein
MESKAAGACATQAQCFSDTTFARNKLNNENFQSKYWVFVCNSEVLHPVETSTFRL